MSPDPATPSPQMSLADKLVVWQVVAERRSSYDAMMWQTPALGMTAQAFLLTLGLAPDTSGTARAVAALLSAVISLMVVQLLGKHRRNELLDTLALADMESRLGLPEHLGFHPHARDRYLAAHHASADRSARTTLLGPRRFWKMSSFRLWCYGQYVLGLASLGILVLVVTGGAGLLT